MSTPEKTNYPILLVALAATFYNAVLAIVNAQVKGLGFAEVAVTEVAILVAALVIILIRGLYEKDLGALFFLVLTLLITVYLSFINKAPVIDYFRNILIVFCFATLGTWTNLKTVKGVILIALFLVLVGLLMEIFFLGAYGDLFYPASYFQNTRGIEPSGFYDTKLFNNALGFEGRFSWGIIDHRSSSLFLEQVSLANFAGVTMIFLLSLWNSFSRRQKAFGLFTVVLILLTNDTRTMLIFSVICFAGYFVFPLLPRIFSLLYMPLFLLAGMVIFILKPDAEGDDIPGRVVLTIRHFGELGVADILGFSARNAMSFADSGYIYVIVSGTVISFVALWLFICFYPACETPGQRRFAHAFCIFMFMNMMIGGTAVFSIKVAGLLWLLAGYLKRNHALEGAHERRMPARLQSQQLGEV